MKGSFDLMNTVQQPAIEGFDPGAVSCNADPQSAIRSGLALLFAGIRARQILGNEPLPAGEPIIDIDGVPIGKSTRLPSAFGRGPFYLDSEPDTWSIVSPGVDPAISVADARSFLLELAEAIALAERLNGEGA